MGIRLRVRLVSILSGSAFTAIADACYDSCSRLASSRERQSDVEWAPANSLMRGRCSIAALVPCTQYLTPDGQHRQAMRITMAVVFG